MSTFNKIDKNTFTKLILDIEKELYNIAHNKINNINDVEDIFQETIIKIYQNFDSLRNIESFKSWAIKILINECNKCYQKKHRDNLLLEKLASSKAIDAEDNSISDFEENSYFKELLNTLPKTEQEIFFYYYQCNYSTKEISKIMHINENTIKSKLKRNKPKLEEIYERWLSMI